MTNDDPDPPRSDRLPTGQAQPGGGPPAQGARDIRRKQVGCAGASARPDPAPPVEKPRHVPLSTAIDAEVAERMRDYAIRAGIALARLIEEAVREHLSVRAHDSRLGHLARIPRASRRPSKREAIEARYRTELLKPRRWSPRRSPRGGTAG